MNELLRQFWEWMQVSPELYASEEYDMNDDKSEFFFPAFTDLIKYAEFVVDSNSLFEDDINDLLTIMALDNESESVLEYIEKHSSEEQLECIVRKGMLHIQPNARWQIAELIYRRKTMSYKNQLIVLSMDKHSYVKKRAMNCLSYLKET